MSDNGSTPNWGAMAAGHFGPTTPNPTGDALPFGVDDGQNIAAKVTIRRPVSLDEVAEVLQSIIELIENGEQFNAQDEARALLSRIKER